MPNHIALREALERDNVLLSPCATLALSPPLLPYEITINQRASHCGPVKDAHVDGHVVAAALSVHDIRGDRGGKVVHEGECGPGHATQEGVGRLTEEGEIDPAAAFTTDSSGTERDD